MPALQRIPQRKANVLDHPIVPQLNRSTSNHNRPGFLPSHHLKKMTEKGEMGLDSQIRLTKVDEGGDVKNRLWIQMNELNLVEMQKTTKESASGDRESAIEEGF